MIDAKTVSAIATALGRPGAVLMLAQMGPNDPDHPNEWAACLGNVITGPLRSGMHGSAPMAFGPDQESAARTFFTMMAARAAEDATAAATEATSKEDARRAIDAAVAADETNTRLLREP